MHVTKKATASGRAMRPSRPRLLCSLALAALAASVPVATDVTLPPGNIGRVLRAKDDSCPPDCVTADPGSVIVQLTSTDDANIDPVELSQDLAGLCQVDASQIQVLVEQSSLDEGEDLGADDEVSFIIDPSPYDARGLEGRLEATKELANEASATDFLGIPVLDIPLIEVTSPEDFCLCRGSSKWVTPR